MNYLSTFGLILTLSASSALGQSAVEHHVWQDARSFEPYSRTAQAITGPITLSGNPEFATPGSVMTLTFGNGVTVDLTSVGASWRKWQHYSEAKQTAEVFLLSEVPGELLNGNRLCGRPSEDPIYAVFHEDRGYLPKLLNMAIFQSSEAPFDINSDGICGTYNYVSGS
jgi:hypothetical protein